MSFAKAGTVSILSQLFAVPTMLPCRYYVLFNYVWNEQKH